MGQQIRMGGVPEHFNFPIHLAKERGDFDAIGVDLQWKDCSGGTGQMTRALRENELDVVVALTEGVVLDIINNNSSRIISGYVKTPLIWGVHTAVTNELTDMSDIFEKVHAISRFGSGSHLMAIVHANSQGESLNTERFKVINDLPGAIDSLNRHETDVFYWEKYTTKPFVDSGRLKRIGEYITPWPCFVIAASDRVLQDHPEKMDQFLDVINESCGRFMEDPDVIQLTAKRYGLDPRDVEKWYHKTEWAINSWVSDKMINSVVYHLRIAEIISEDQKVPELIWKR